MTNNQLTDKRLAQLAKRNFCQTRGEEYTPFGDEVVSMAAELQERRKADSEPVGYFGRFDPDDDDLIDQCSKNVKGAFPLYRHAQPAPVAQDERAAFNAWNNEDNLPIAGVRAHNAAWLAWQARAAMCAVPQPAPVVPEINRKAIANKVHGECSRMPGATFYNAAEFAIDEVEASLAAAPHATPALDPEQSVVTVSDTWIPVNERNPDDIGRYWCYVEDQKSHGEYSYHWNCSWNGSYWSGAMMHGRVTHWMPLPAAPQEVKGE